MPRKKKTIIEESIPDDVTSNINDDVNDIIVTLTKVYKLNNGTRSFCFQTAEPVDEVTVQAQYPSGGKFIVLEYNGLNQLLNTIHLDIEPKPLSINHPNGNGTMDIQNRMLLDELAWTRQMILSLIGNRQGNQESTPVAELVQAVQGIHAIAPSGRDPVELLIKGMELGSKVNSSASGDWKSELIHTAKEVLTPAVEAFSSIKQQTQHIQNPMNTQALSPATLLKQGIVWIKSKILSGLEPGLAVDWILRNATDPQYQPFLALAVQGTLDNFIELDSDIANEPYRAWFTTAIAMMKDAYAEQSQHSSDMDGGNGNSPNPSVDAESRSRKPKIAKAV